MFTEGADEAWKAAPPLTYNPKDFEKHETLNLDSANALPYAANMYFVAKKIQIDQFQKTHINGLMVLHLERGKIFVKQMVCQDHKLQLVHHQQNKHEHITIL